jgi:hypothetical protein
MRECGRRECCCASLPRVELDNAADKSAVTPSPAEPSRSDS